ncbi:MAG TPA: alanyl-tRNA editing protein [Myxococcales bacterium]|nr:alanyl-tRNA editing protein [Myxococcales bacterium]
MKLVECQKDAYQRELTTAVLDCAETERGWDVQLAETILYPEGGGQPSDHGTIGGALVLDVKRNTSGQVIHLVDAPVAGEKVVVQVDWSRRYDHMQQHTAQHLLTAIAQDRFGHETTAFHLSTERCDIELDTEALSPDVMNELENAVNSAIRDQIAVRHRLVEISEFETLNVRTRGLPADHSGRVRLVEIEGIDLNTCGGTHVSSTSELQMIKLLGTENIRGGSRLFYWSGGRVLGGLSGALERERNLTQALSVGAGEHTRAVERLLTDGYQALKSKKLLLREMGQLIGHQLAAEEGQLLSYHSSEGDLALLSQVAAVLSQKRPELLALLTCGDPNGEGLFLLVGPQEGIDGAKQKLCELMDARGGGAGGRFQGKAGKLGGRSALIESLS